MKTAIPKTITDTHTNKEKNNPNTTLKMVIKSEGRRAKEGRNKKEL